LGNVYEKMDLMLIPEAVFQVSLEGKVTEGRVVYELHCPDKKQLIHGAIRWNSKTILQRTVR